MRPTRSRTSLLLAGLSTTAVLGTTPATAADDAGVAAAGVTGSNQLVALRDADGAQATSKSRINGSATVASADGRYVVFSTAAALVPEDTNRLDDVYRRDTVAGTTTLVSTTAKGRIGNDYSTEPSISAGGRFVAFTSFASNLVKDTNGHTLDVLVKDMSTGALRLVSRTSAGKQTGRNSFFPVIAGGGRYVAFQTFGRFGPRDQDRREDVYVHDRRRGTTRQVSLTPAGKDVRSGVLVGGISADGRKITFGDDNSAWVRDRVAGRTTRFWHEPDDPSQPFPAGTVGRPVVSGDGRFVAFSTRSRFVVDGDRGHLSDVFRLNLGTGRFVKVTVSRRGGNANEESGIPSLSHDGRYVGFMSAATNLVAGDIPGVDVFVRDLRQGVTTQASVAPDGTPGDEDSGRNGVAISADGQTLVYESYARNLVPDDTNGWLDVLAWHR